MLSLSLIENAADSLSHATDHIGSITKNDISGWKREGLDLSHVIELLFKERLRKAHPAFIFEKVDDYTSSKKTAQVRTVSFKKSLDRLKNIAGITFSKNDSNYIKRLNKRRNEIMHYDLNIKSGSLFSNMLNSTKHI
jgi:hypothetical protein